MSEYREPLQEVLKERERGIERDRTPERNDTALEIRQTSLNCYLVFRENQLWWSCMLIGQ